MTRSRSRRWCFTLNNYTHEDELMLQNLITTPVTASTVSYIIYGREVGSEGTAHLQGYLETKSKIGLRSLKSLIGRRFHLEKARGSFQENKNYCTKEDQQPFEKGSPMQQGKRTDLEEIKKYIDEGKDEEFIADNFFSQWVVYRKSFKAYATLKSKPRVRMTKCFVLWGKTGTGKTRFVHEQAEGRSLWTVSSHDWFDGYCNHEIVLLDDYRGEYPIALFLRLIDRYPMQVPVKGGFTEWNPSKVYITSNVEPRDWYPHLDADTYEAFMRRLSGIYEINVSLY